jgi:hypothetical protein
VCHISLVKRIAGRPAAQLAGHLLIAAGDGAGEPERRLPAWHRTHGKHLCLLHSGAPSNRQSLLTTQQRCPLFSQLRAIAAHHETVAPTASRAIFGVVIIHHTLSVQTAARSYGRHGQNADNFKSVAPADFATRAHFSL